jgi:hypothetical protein
VIDRVELVSLHQSHQMRKLHRDNAAGLERDLHAGNEIVQIRHLGQYVVSDQQIGLLSPSNEVSCGIGPEKTAPGRNLFRAGCLRDVRSRLDSKDRNPRPDEVLKQLTVVARELDHEAPVIQIETLSDGLGICARVFDPAA